MASKINIKVDQRKNKVIAVQYPKFTNECILKLKIYDFRS